LILIRGVGGIEFVAGIFLIDISPTSALPLEPNGTKKSSKLCVVRI
jgi:hypothetical protein